MSRILIVDDHVDICDALTRLFQRCGWAAAYETDGRHVPDVLRTSEADVVLLDVMMPGVDGFGVLQAIRADPAIAGTPVVMYSSLSDAETVRRARTAGACDYLVKGTPFDQIQQTLARHAATRGH